MPLTYRTADPAWGDGKGAPLTPAEVDGNFHALDTRLRTLETTGLVTPESVARITAEGATATALGTRGSTLGTFTLPMHVPSGAVPWQAATAYARGVLLTAPDQASGPVYITNTAFTSASAFAEDLAAGRLGLFAGGGTTGGDDDRGGGAWSRVLSVTSPHTVSADDVGALLEIPAGGSVTLPAIGVTAGDALWLQTVLDGGASLQVAGATLEGGTALTLVSERVWLVHEGDGAWRVAVRTPLPGTQTQDPAPSVWRSTISVAAGASHTVAASDSGVRFVLGASATLNVPASASLGDGAGLWVEGASGASVNAALAGGTTTLSVAGRRVLLVADALGAVWVVAINRPVTGEDGGASGTLAAQDADAVAITGGSLSGVVVSGGRAHGLALTHQALGTVATACVFNVAQAASFSLTPTATINLSFTGWSASGLHMVQVELTGGADHLTWTGVTWEGGAPPAFSSGAGIDIVLVWTRDGGATVFGKLGGSF